MTPSTISKSVSGWLTRLTASSLEAEAELLHRYATAGDQEAFAALTERFAPLVWGVCSRALRRPQDAEDAFQATFLALAKQAAGLTDRGGLAPWLHQVARRSAALVYRQNQRRREVPVDSTPAVAPPPVDDRELVAALDEEIERLPEKYRRPVVLCHIQQQTYAEAAQALGYSVPTVCRRVTQGCELLRKQLTRRGLAPTAGLAVLFAAVAQPAAAVPPGLVARTVRAVRSGEAAAVTGIADATLRSTNGSRAFLYTVGASVIALAGALGVALALHAPPPAEPPPAAETVQAPAPAGLRVDRLGDPLPEGAVARIGTLRMRGEGGAPGDVAFLPGGQTVASVHGRAAVWVWDIETGKELRRIPAPARSHLLASSPDGRLLAVCGTDEVRLLNVGNPAAATTVWSWAAAKPDTGLRVIAVTFSPDGKTLAVGDALAGVVRLLDVSTGLEQRVLAGSASQLAFTPDGKTLGGVKGTPSVAGSVDGYRLVLWDPESGLPREAPAAASKLIRRFVFVGGSVIVTDARGDRQARVVDMSTGRETARWPDRGLHSVLAPTPDGTAVAELAEGKVTVRDLASGHAVRATGAVRELSIVDRQADVFNWRFSGDGRFFAATTRGGQVWVWDVAAGKEAGPPGRIHGGVQSLAFSPDGSTLTTLHGSAGRSWEAGSGLPAAPLNRGEGELAAHEIVFPDATGPTVIQFPTPADHSLRATAWNATTGVAVDRMPIPTDVWHTGAASGAVSPDGRWLAWGTPAVVSLINRATGQEVRRLTPATRTTASLRFSADGQTLLRVPTGRDTAEVWDAETGELRAKLRLPPKNRATTSLPVIGLSADGRWLAVAGKQPDGAQALTLIEVATATSYQLPTPTTVVHALAFAPDGRRLAAAAEDGSVRVWDLALGKELRSFRGHRGRALTVLFSPDGNRIASGGFDGTGLIWDAPQPAAASGPRSFNELWADLAGGDPAAAHRATFSAAAGAPALGERLRTETGPAAARGIAVLEQAGTPAARDALKQLAARGDSASVARDAAAALQRLTRQKTE